MAPDIPLDIDGYDDKSRLDLDAFLNRKRILVVDFGDWRDSKTRDRRRLLELLVENVVDDISTFGKLVQAAMEDPDLHLDDIKKEDLKRLLFRYLGLTDDVRPSDP